MKQLLTPCSVVPNIKTGGQMGGSKQSENEHEHQRNGFNFENLNSGRLWFDSVAPEHEDQNMLPCGEKSMSYF